MNKNRKITDIKVKKNNIKRKKIYIDHELFIELDDTIINDLNLYIGKTITDNLIDTIQQKETLNRAKNDSIRFLSYRPRTEWEMTNKLQNKSYQTGIVDKTMQWLKDNKLIDDREFCLMWIKDRINNKPMGKLKLKKDLYNKGIDTELIENTIHSFFEKDKDELELAYQLIDKKKDSFQSKNIPLEPKKVISLLKSRGFSYQIIHHIYNELFTD